MLRHVVIAGAALALVVGCEDRSNQPAPPRGGVTGSGGQTTPGTKGTTPSTTQPSTTQPTTPSTTPGASGMGKESTPGAGGTSGQGGMTGQASAADQSFVKQAMSVNRMEMDLGRLGAQQAQNQEVKTFAQRLVQDHTDAQNDLAQVVQRLGISVQAPEMDSQAQQIKDQLSSLQGQDFDKQFLQKMIDGHTKAIDAFQRETTDGKDPAIKAWAQQQLPTLKQHLQTAQDLMGRIGNQPGTPPSDTGGGGAPGGGGAGGSGGGSGEPGRSGG